MKYIMVPELEQQLLRLSPPEKLRIIQLLALSLNTLWDKKDREPPSKLSEFFRQSPLAEVGIGEELDLSRDRSLPHDRFCL